MTAVGFQEPVRTDATWLVMYAIYDSPRDYPGQFVARRFLIRDTSIPKECIVRNTLAEVRSALPPGLTRLDRAPNDEPQIVEVWL